MVTFALAPGAMHSTWRRNLVVARLRKLGHASVTVDLLVDDRDAGVSEYAGAIPGVGRHLAHRGAIRRRRAGLARRW